MSSSKINVEALARETDVYELLGITSAPDNDFSKVQVGEIRRAYRKAALVYHPDKNSSKDAADKFHLLSIALDVLCNDDLRFIYDSIRQAQNAKKRKLEQLDGERRRMQTDLEAREAKAKQSSSSSGTSSPFATHDSGWFSDGKKKSKTNNWSSTVVSQAVLDQLRNQADKMKQAKQEELGRGPQFVAADEAPKPQTNEADNNNNKTSQFTEKDRTIKVRWRQRRRRRQQQQEDIDPETILRKWMSRFGEIENIVVVPSNKKFISGLVVYSKVSSAFDAVSAQGEGDDGDEEVIIKDIQWAYKAPVHEATTTTNSSDRPEDYEQATLMRLRQKQQERQAERERLEKEIIQQEEKEE